VIAASLPDREVMGEVHGEGVCAFFPGGALGAWDLTQPLHHVGGAILLIFHGFGDKAEWVVAPPVLSFLFQSVNDQLVDFFLIHRPRSLKILSKNCHTGCQFALPTPSEFIRMFHYPQMPPLFHSFSTLLSFIFFSRKIK
jgi:hypothetical protein